MTYMYTTLVLNAHLPYVRHREANHIEERRFFEALSDSYIPLLWILEDNEINRKWTISFSPSLIEMLTDPLMQRRFLNFLEKTESLLQIEMNETSNEKEAKLIKFYLSKYEKIKNTYLNWNQNLLLAFKHFFEVGKIECITTAASHAILPYLQTKQGVKAQIVEGIRCFHQHFGKRPKGFWLPECAYSPGIDRILYEEGILYTFVDAHALRNADPTPSKEIGAPIYSPHGIVLFPRNQELSNKVLDSNGGYASDHDYRHIEGKRQSSIVHHDGGRVDSRSEYHWITGNTEEKDCYVREWVEAKVQHHSEDFLNCLKVHAETNGSQCFPPHTVVLPFEAELFGYWWYEGPEWLQKVLSTQQENIEFITPLQFVNRHYQDLETCHVSFSTWGKDGYGDVWLNNENEWMYRHIHQIEKDIIRAVADFWSGNTDEVRALKQMVREWFLLSSSDWAHMIDNETTAIYATARFKEHVERYHKLRVALYSREVSDVFLTKIESDYPFLSEIDLSTFTSSQDLHLANELVIDSTNSKSLNILLLTWEFPPRVVGGLARHVFDLSRALAKSGHNIYVITTYVEGHHEYEMMEGVHVYRVKGLQPHAEDFLQWVGSLNISLAEQAFELLKKIQFDIIHAHDWLVSVAAEAVKDKLQIPLITTIHATEYGRNNGIHSLMQTEIHRKEEQLINSSDSVIVCSEYMKNELISIFNVTEEKISVFPNGVDPLMIQEKSGSLQVNRHHGDTHSHIIFSVGRIVKEKGFETIIEAAPIILERYPTVLFIIAGKGPMLENYRQVVREKHLETNIRFIGFINDDERNHLLKQCDIVVIPSLYEPFGIVALEAMICNKPTVVSNTGGLKGIIEHGETGLTMLPGNPGSLAKEVLTLIENKQLAKEIAKKGKLMVTTTFSWEKVAKDTSNLFQEKVFNHNNIRG